MIICYTVTDIWHATDVIIFHFGPFLPFYPPNSMKNQNFTKMKILPGDIIISHSYTKNHDHMLFTGPEMWHMTDVIAIFNFGLFFAHPPP